jgi:prepilin-type N-terminal cleavage/methylation domain-containing protein
MRGFTLVEVVTTLALVLVVSAIALPITDRLRQEGHVRGAAFAVAARCGRVRFSAVHRAAHVGLRFSASGDTWVVQSFVDGDWDGVRAADIVSRRDPAIDEPLPVQALFPGRRLALSPGARSSTALPWQMALTPCESARPAGVHAGWCVERGHAVPARRRTGERVRGSRPGSHRTNAALPLCARDRRVNDPCAMTGGGSRAGHTSTGFAPAAFLGRPALDGRGRPANRAVTIPSAEILAKPAGT